METSMEGSSSTEYNVLEEVVRSRSHRQETNLTPSRENTDSLKAIQKIILYYENKALSLDEVLKRVLETYNETVPYK
jgi:endonuclease III